MIVMSLKYAVGKMMDKRKPSPLAYLIATFMFASTPQVLSASESSDLPKLMLMSFDGFGWNFLSKLAKSDIPNFQKFIDTGVHVKWIENVFPTVTRTNHMSLVSGLYAESHGIVNNHFYDSVLKESMPSSGELNVTDSKWTDVGAEPVWVTNTMAGGKRRSGCILWPCADAKIKGMLPDRIKPGEWSVTREDFNQTQRVDMALEWLTDLLEPVNFVAVYFTEPDETSHHHGPDSEEVLNIILDYDKLLGYLLDQVQRKGLSGKLNIIITADHGQVPTYNDAEINIDNLIDPAWYSVQPWVSSKQSVINLWPKEGFFDRILARLKHYNLHVLLKNSTDLSVLNYTASSRIAPIVAYTEPGWLITNSYSASNSSGIIHKGSHGWDPRYCINMYPFFIATGPAFRTGVRDAAPFKLVDIYPLMCHILGLKPAANNGSLDNVWHILVTEESNSQKSSLMSYSGVAVGAIVVVLGIVTVVVVLWKIRQSRNVSASYKRSFSQAGSHDELLQEGMVILSDEEL